MKPVPKKSPASRRPSREVTMKRYPHPIPKVHCCTCRDPSEEMILSMLLEAAARQEQLLMELLHRVEKCCGEKPAR